MVYIIFSDVHSNLEALQAFEKIIKELPHDKRVCLGDIVGYGVDPNPVTQWIRENCQIVLGGNHDFAIIGKTETSYFNPYALKACIWTRDELNPTNRGYLKSLGAKRMVDDITWAHSSPFEPEGWHYVVSADQGKVNFQHFYNQLCFVGHSHIPLILEQNPEGKIEAFFETEYGLKPEHRYIVNVGSLGQPRDNNPNPAFVVYHSERGSIQFHRFSYNFETTQKKILNEGLPKYLADRLSAGH